MAYFTSGMRLTSALLEGLPKPLGAKILAQAGAYLTTSGGTELKLPKLTLTGITLVALGSRRFKLNARLVGGTAGDNFEFQVRQANDTSGTVVGSFRYSVKDSNQGEISSENIDTPVSGSVVNETFYLSVIRRGGTGTITVQGDSQTSFACDSALTSNVVVRVP